MTNSSKRTGLFPGKFLPLHRGHLTAILRAHAMCDRLIVVINDDPKGDAELCEQAGFPAIPGLMRQRWLAQELQGLGIDIVRCEESGLCQDEQGWASYIRLLQTQIAGPVQLIFGGEERYRPLYLQHWPQVHYQLIDPQRTQWPISGTEIRHQPYRHWDYIAGAARPFFARRVLLSGPESCGKTTLTRKLAKVYCTSWSEELGRDYQDQVVGGNGDLFELEDFNRIAHLQYEQDIKALRSANKVCFFDTDAVVTAFFSQQMMGQLANRIESFIDPTKFDLVILLKPTVPWVADGMRELGAPEQRQHAFDELLALYLSYGFQRPQLLVIEASDYLSRLDACIGAVDQLLYGTRSDG